MHVLEEYAKTGSGSADGLDGYCDAWRKAHKGPDFLPAQSQVQRGWYANPPLAYTSKYGVQYGIPRAVLYDAAVSNDVYTNGTCLGLTLGATNAQFSRDMLGDSGSTLNINGHKVDELIWLRILLLMRLAIADEWSAKNVNAFLDTVDQG
ncbi:hypothetical protein IWW40_002915 [Coemansia sp. RSA 1250]|nr:hypothetical protein IWW40_002915 [Coemansia sp. RSA 1250]